MRIRTWPVAALALGALLLLVVVALLESSRRTEENFTRLDALNARYHEVEARLRRLRSAVNLSGIFVRDYLLDPSPERGPEYRGRLAAFRSESAKEFSALRSLTQTRGNVSSQLDGLERRLDDYWRTIDPLVERAATEKVQTSAQFLRTEVLPRREAVLAIAAEIEAINDATLSAQRAEEKLQQESLRWGLYKLLWTSLVLGVIVAATAVFRLRRLEQRSEEQRVQAENAERQMRQLSQQLVAAQEHERTRLSRELHDDVGQMLTALRMELGTIDRLRMRGDEPIARAVAEGRKLLDTMVGTVRDLALGLRPSMLDDLGLQPALEWQVRDFSRRYELPVHLAVQGNVAQLPPAHRTCVYRVVQEALTNCARHASASRVSINVRRTAAGLDVIVVDDGVGFEAGRRRGRFGLYGIEERVKELGGETTVKGTKGVGTTLRATLPVTWDISDEDAIVEGSAG